MVGLHCRGLAPGGDPRARAEAGRILGSRSQGTRPPPAGTRGGTGGAGDAGHPWTRCPAPSPRPLHRPSSSLPRQPRLKGARGGARPCAGDGVPTAAPTAAPAARSSRRPDGTPRPVRKGRQLFSQAAVGGSRGDGDRCGSPSRGGRGKAGCGSVPRLEATPAPQPNPRERPGRRRVWRRKRPETVRFHAALGLGFRSRVDE